MGVCMKSHFTLNHMYHCRKVTTQFWKFEDAFSFPPFPLPCSPLPFILNPTLLLSFFLHSLPSFCLLTLILFFYPNLFVISSAVPFISLPVVAPVAPGCIWSLQTPCEPPVLLTCPGLLKSAEPGQTHTHTEKEMCVCYILVVVKVGLWLEQCEFELYSSYWLQHCPNHKLLPLFICMRLKCVRATCQHTAAVWNTS